MPNGKQWLTVNIQKSLTIKIEKTATNLDVFDTESVGLCNGAYGCEAVGVDEFDWPGL